jgi:hypothetical protein
VLPVPLPMTEEEPLDPLVREEVVARDVEGVLKRDREDCIDEDMEDDPPPIPAAWAPLPPPEPPLPPRLETPDPPEPVGLEI